MLFFANYLYAQSICFYGGLTATDLLRCIYNGDYEYDYQILSIEGNMLPTQQILIQFNGAKYGYVRELEVDYCIGDCPGA